MNEEQQAGYIAFVANFVNQLHEAHMPKEQAEAIATLAASCLLATIFHLQAGQDETLDTFVALALKQAMKMIYKAK